MPLRGTSDEHHNMFLGKNKKNTCIFWIKKKSALSRAMRNEMGMEQFAELLISCNFGFLYVNFRSWYSVIFRDDN